MLENLLIRNYVIVDELDLNFLLGFSSLTGETGAGKSILIDALSLALGSRSESGVVKKGNEKADITATFNLEGNDEAKAWLSQNEFEESDNQLLLRRVIYKDGKSKAFINGIPSTISQLKSIGESLVDIYSQNIHHSLLKKTSQREILDSFLGFKEELRNLKKFYSEWQRLFLEQDKFLKNKESFLNELNEIEDRYNEFSALNFTYSEWQQLQIDQKFLANGNELISGVNKCISMIDDGDISLNSLARQVQVELKSLYGLDKRLENANNIMHSMQAESMELSRELTNYLQNVDIDENLQQSVEEKIQSIFSFCRKFNVKPEDLEAESEKWLQRLEELKIMLSDKDISLLVSEAKTSYDEIASKVTNKRVSAAILLSKLITEKLNQLSFNDASFNVELSSIDPSINGNESIQFLVSTFKGAELQPIQKVLSGGELSRISLAIRVASISNIEVPTMIFDEVDVGIGGGVAEVVGNLLKDLGGKKHTQALVITHLPQVAAKSDHHYKVSKKQVENSIYSEIRLLNEADRVDEIARMLGGIKVTDKAIDHAKEILG
ncbi:MAG: DNA repair protein RecN [Nitrosomonadales bacterium]|mgnify:FL=1|jgi:DNA repair protein RecN (Recombination protein N)|nr:DNA repair protein RecN [Nitrosomonadales bacterium]MBT4570759.1 DNA repair protein RecN [Nitrosomonadales bacterium]MBT6014406.1 DNA repair protein RecN [Nitrosomonadales bacterium]